MVLEHPDGQAPDEVDQGDHDGGDGIAADELGCAVHGAVEVGLVGHLLSAAAGLRLVDGAGVQVGIDGHLLAGHAVEREARRHLCNAAGTRGDHHELDHDQDEEHDQPDQDRAAHHEVTEALDHDPRVTVQEDEAGGGHVQGEAEHGRHQHEGGEDREVERTLDLHRGQQDQDRAGDVGRNEQVHHEGRQRHDQHDDDSHHRQRDGHGDHAPPARRLPTRGDDRGRVSHVPILRASNGRCGARTIPPGGCSRCPVPGRRLAFLAVSFYVPPRRGVQTSPAAGTIWCTGRSALAVGERE